jgi:hypothetical protein
VVAVAVAVGNAVAAEDSAVAVAVAVAVVAVGSVEGLLESLSRLVSRQTREWQLRQSYWIALFV